MPELSLLHVRHYTYYRSSQVKGEEEVAWNLQKWASGLFAFMDSRGYCPNLRALVIGMWRKPDHDSLCDGISRHSFLKGKQQVGLYRGLVVAVPVSTQTLREEEPSSTILDSDPGCEWYGGKPGQFDMTSIPN